MRHTGRTREQRLQGSRGAAHGIGLQRLAPGLHEHNDTAGQVLAGHGGADDGQRGDDVGGELPTKHAPHGAHDDR